MNNNLLILLSTCKPQKRLNRLITNHLELLTKDAVIVYGTTFVKELKFDTFALITPGASDTIFIKKDDISVKIIRSFDTLKVFVNRPPATIIKPIPVVIDKIKYIKTNYMTLFFDNIVYI